MKIVLIGAGSHDFGRGQITDILQAKELQGGDVTLSLVDVDHDALDTMTRFAKRVGQHVGSEVTIESTPDRCAALPGADYVIVAVARKRMELWEQDFRVPLAYGFRHCLGENGGPGALFHALRSFELVIPICHDMERLCPDALLLNFTNPEARVLHAILTLTKVRAVGICHGVFASISAASRILQRPEEDLDIVSAGMNHFYTFLKVQDRRTGEDLLPELLEKATATTAFPQESHVQLFQRMVRIFGMFSYPSDDHIGEYLAYGSEFTGIRWPYGQESRPVGAQTPSPTQTMLEECARGQRSVCSTLLRESGEITVPIICDIALNRNAFRPAVNVLNSERYIENLDADGVVEVPALVDAQGVHPQKVGPLPRPLATMINLQYGIHNLLTEAYRLKSRELLLQALLLDPTVNSTVAAEEMLDTMLQLQKDYLPSFFA